MVEFGRIGYVTIRDKNIKKKTDERAIKAIMVVYAKSHSGDTYRMFNPATKRIILSRDVKWAEWKRTDPKSNMDVFVKYDSTDIVPGIDEVVVEIAKLPEIDKATIHLIPDDDGHQEYQDSRNAKSDENLTNLKNQESKLDREMKKLDTSYNPTVTGNEEKESIKEGNVVVTGNAKSLPIEIPESEMMDFIVELHNTAVTSDVGDPVTFEGALGVKRGKLWKFSMISEVNNFLYRDAWMPRNLAKVRKKVRKPIPTKWVFKTKLEANGTERLKSRIVTKGYLQVPGVDFTEKFSPVATDTSTRIIIGLTLYYTADGWICEAFDVEAAFLEPYLDIEMYIEWPDGIVELGFITEEQRRTTCIQLRRSMYGNVDAALRWQREFTNYLVQECGFVRCRSDPCILFLREEGILKIVMSIHVDDSLCAGSKEDLENLYRNVRKKYKITTLGIISKYLGVRYEWKTDGDGNKFVIATMKKNADDIVKYYEDLKGTSVKVANTPGFQNTVMSKNQDESIMMEQYRSLVGKILFYVVKVGPDCANATRDLARHMSNPGEEQWKAMERLVGYLKGKELHGLIMRRPESLRVINYCDASYATDKDLRRSVSGMVGSIGGMVINWSSRTQKVCTLSSAESEYISLGECGQDLKFVCMFLQEIGIGIMPGLIYEDNEGAIFLAKNQQVGMRTKHIDVKYHFIRDLVQENYLEIRYVLSEENYTDVLTKNVSR